MESFEPVEDVAAPPLFESPNARPPFMFGMRRSDGNASASGAATVPSLPAHGQAHSAFASFHPSNSNSVPPNPNPNPDTPANTPGATPDRSSPSSSRGPGPFAPLPNIDSASRFRGHPPGLPPGLPSHISVSIAPLGLNGLRSAQSLSSSPSRFDSSQSNSVGVFSSQQQASNSRSGQGVASQNSSGSGSGSGTSSHRPPRTSRSGSEPLLPSSRQNSRHGAGSSNDVPDVPFGLFPASVNSAGPAQGPSSDNRENGAHGPSVPQIPLSRVLQNAFARAMLADDHPLGDISDSQENTNASASASSSASAPRDNSGTMPVPGSFHRFFIPLGSQSNNDSANGEGTQQQGNAPHLGGGPQLPPGISVRRFTFTSHFPRMSLASRGARFPSSESQYEAEAPQNPSQPTEQSPENPQTSQEDDTKMSDDVGDGSGAASSTAGSGAASSANDNGTAATHLLRTPTATGNSASSTSYSYVAPSRRSARLNVDRSSSTGSRRARAHTRGGAGTRDSSSRSGAHTRPEYLRARERASMARARGRRGIPDSAAGSATSTSSRSGASGSGGMSAFGEQLVRAFTSQLVAERVARRLERLNGGNGATATGATAGTGAGNGAGVLGSAQSSNDGRRPSPSPASSSSSASSASSSASSGRRASFLEQIPGSSFLVRCDIHVFVSV